MKETPQQKINYPYLPEGKTIQYVTLQNPFMQEAYQQAKNAYENAENSDGKKMTLTSVIITKEGEIIGKGINGDGYHQKKGCVRVEKNMPSGVGYDMCPGCTDINHAEPVALRNAINNGSAIEGADLYLYGHWWCCEPCWNAMIQTGIKNIYLLEKSEVLFDRDNPNNIITTQFMSKEA